MELEAVHALRESWRWVSQLIQTCSSSLICLTMPASSAAPPVSVSISYDSKNDQGSWMNICDSSYRLSSKTVL